MKRSFIFVTCFFCLFFIAAVIFSLLLNKETKTFLSTHENLYTFQKHLSKTTSEISQQIDSFFIQKQLQGKTPIELNFLDTKKNLHSLINSFREGLDSYGCQNCHKKTEPVIKNILENLEKIAIKTDNIAHLSVLYVADTSKARDILNEKDAIKSYAQTISDSLTNMENSYHNFLIKKINIYPVFYIFFSFFSLFLTIVIASVLYKNFLKDFFKLSKLCKLYEQNKGLGEFDTTEFKSKEMKMLAETILNTFNKLRENEMELEQQFEEIKGMNEELQATNQQLELITEELEETKRELERRVEEKTRQLEKAYEELKDLDRMKSNFLQSMSHEFKTPLTPLFGYLKLFKNKELGELTPLQEQSIDIMLTCAEKLYNTIDDLLFLARLNLEKEHYMLKDIDLSYLIKNITNRVEKELEEKKLKLIINVPDFSLVIKGEQLMLTQAILHLIRNAIKYSQDKGEIVILLSLEDKNAVLRIIDSGAGMPENVLKSINTYLSSLDTSMDLKGDFITLGLNILKRVVAFHKAKVYYKSERNKGTEVGIIFPLRMS